MTKAVLLTLLTLLTANAQMPSPKGITKVNVWIDLQGSEGTGSCADTSLAKYFNLAESDVRTDTELQLRKAGLAVLAGEAPARVHIAVTGCVIENAYARVATMIVLLTLEESATADRGKRGVVISWYTLGSTTNPHDPRATIQDAVARLINQWLADK